MFGWFRNRRRKKILSSAINATHLEWIRRSCWQLEYLPGYLQQQLIQLTRVLAVEKRFEGCNGLSVTEQIRFAISSQIALMLLGYPGEYMNWVSTILVYPETYIAQDNLFHAGSNISVVGPQAREGQTTTGGPVIVNWSSISGQVFSADEGVEFPYDRSDPSRNLVIHEFAHQLDMFGSSVADGIPPLASHLTGRWSQQFSDCFADERDKYSDRYGFRIDPYGLSSLVEFFAVCSESYFQFPHSLGRDYSEAYSLLRQFYRIDLREFVPVVVE